jgi:glycerophosphoryl diester phosphodiesterase
MSNPLLDPAARLVIGHRGASADAPENTLPAFALALAQGADALELDVHATADGVPVVIHDPTLDRTTDRRGAVAGLGAEDVRAAQVPSLAEVLDAFPRTPLLIEVKSPAATAPLADVIRRHGAAGRVAVAAFDAAALQGLAGTGIAVGASRRDAQRLVLAAYLGVRAGAGPRFYALPDRYRGLPVPTRWVVATARRLGRPVHVWTVDDPARAVALWRRGVCGIISNRPGAIHAVRHRVATGGAGS